MAENNSIRFLDTLHVPLRCTFRAILKAARCHEFLSVLCNVQCPLHYEHPHKPNSLQHVTSDLIFFYRFPKHHVVFEFRHTIFLISIYRSLIIH